MRIDASSSRLKPLGYANVGRYGLAHSLLAWARCELWCVDHGLKMLAPTWAHLRIGPYLRREMDKRAYHKLFEFHDYITGLRRLYLLNTIQRVNAEEINLAKVLNAGQRRIVVFNNRMALNEENHFHEIIGRQEMVRSALVRITRTKYQPAATVRQSHIAIHIRMGDFTQLHSIDALRQGAKNARLPLVWYAEMLRGLRERLGMQLSARVYSDGSDEELRPLLEQAAVSRACAQTAVTDLLSISQASVLISSGSGFSQWGSYLGHVPRVCFPGQRMVRVHGVPDGMDLEPECETAAHLPSNFIAHVANTIKARPGIEAE